MCAATRVPQRTRRCPARRPASSPGRRPRRPGRIRASGSSAPAAPAGETRPAPGPPLHPRPAPVREDRLSPSCAPSFRTTPTSARYIHRPGRELGGSRAPSFPVPRCMHHRPPERSAHPKRSPTMTRTPVTSDKLPPLAGPFSPGVQSGSGPLFISGQVGQDPATGALVDGDVIVQAHQALRNLTAVLEAAGKSLDDVVRIGVYLTDMGEFAAIAS